MRLHVFPPSPRAMKVIALANHLGLDCELRVVHLFNGDQLKPEFIALNPNKRMPVLEDDGFVLWESNAILHYLATKKPESRLWPSDAKGQADVLRWLSWEAAHWTPACTPMAFERVVKKLGGLGEPDLAEVAKGEAGFHQFAAVLNAHLKGRKWLLGNDLTIADFAVGAPMAMAEPAQYPLATYAEITRWYSGLAALPAWKRATVAPPT
ncbi:MAG: glutathione S-transferase family protein [Deltaproteobacteria bacterium]|nr:glutathione S-transferase family protein [Deltaproteobacteria bacterium]MBI3391280.1 glutathione S-transferase family protein [Deltaproteobacteria bacterium]